MAVHFARFHLKVGNRGFEVRIPIHQPLVAIQQPLIVKLNKHLDDGLAKPLIHREAFVGPIATRAQTAELGRDRPPTLGLPFLHLVDKFIAGEIGALLLMQRHLPLNHHLRGNPGVISADHPQRILALQAGVADEDVLQCIIQRMADVQAARHIGRRHDDGIRFRIGARRAERARPFPMGIPFGFNGGGIECFGEIGHIAVRHSGGQCKIPRLQIQGSSIISIPASKSVAVRSAGSGLDRKT